MCAYTLSPSHSLTYMNMFKGMIPFHKSDITSTGPRSDAASKTLTTCHSYITKMGTPSIFPTSTGCADCLSSTCLPHCHSRNLSIA